MSGYQAQAPPGYPSGTRGAPAMSGGPPTRDQKRNHAQAMAPQAQAAPPVYHASPNPPQGGRRILHIYHEGWNHLHTKVMDSDKVTPIYSVESNRASLFSSKPHMTIVNAATGAVAGIVTFHTMSGGIDVEIHGRRVMFDRPSIWSTTHQFQSLANGSVFKWKKDGMFSGGDLVCLDEREQKVATFENSTFAMQKDGKLEIAPWVDGLFFDEVLITGLAAVEYFRRRRQNSSAAGGGGGGGGC